MWGEQIALLFQKENQINKHTKLRKPKKNPLRVVANQTLVFNQLLPEGKRDV
jgi:hypothetical protein